VGARGEIVGTGFMSEVMPFIRYRTDDFAILSGDACAACGRAQMLLSQTRGHRAQEFLVTKNTNVVIAWTALNMHDDTFDGIMRFQFHQKAPGTVELRMVPAPGASYNLDRIRRHLAAKLEGMIDVTVTICDAIPPLKSGKKPMVIQEIPDVDRLFAALGLDAAS
jgi:phenylacetate-coenzyme A ligase PaaK-like adenylate-forming protein